MTQYLKSRALLALLALLGLGVGYALPRRAPRGDLLDAVARVQRRSPYFLITEPWPTAHWAREGALYLCRTPRTAEEVEALSKRPERPGPGWAGVVCFKGTAGPRVHYAPWPSGGGERCLHYGSFAVYGDPELLAEVHTILAAGGLHPLR